MKNIIYFVILVILTSCKTTTPNDNGKVYSLEDAIEVSSQNISEDLDGNIIVAIVNFRASSEVFSEYVIEETIIALGNKKKQKIVDRNHIEVLRKEWDFQYSGDVSDESLQSLGKLLGAQEIISGQIIDLDSVFRFQMFSLNVETAERKVGVSVDVAKTNRVLALLKNDAPIIASSTSPANTQQEVLINQSPTKIDRSIVAAFSGSENKFKLIAVPNHLNNIYSNGEYLNISIQSERNCYIKIFILDDVGNLKQIYPTSRMDNDFIVANSTVRIPNKNQFKINFSSAYQYILIGAYEQSHITYFYETYNQSYIIPIGLGIGVEMTSDEVKRINGGAVSTSYFSIRSPGRGSPPSISSYSPDSIIWY